MGRTSFLKFLRKGWKTHSVPQKTSSASDPDDAHTRDTVADPISHPSPWVKGETGGEDLVNDVSVDQKGLQKRPAKAKVPIPELRLEIHDLPSDVPSTTSVFSGRPSNSARLLRPPKSPATRLRLDLLLLRARITSAVDGRRFIPLDTLNDLINQSSVQSALIEAQMEGQRNDSLINYILHNSKKIFATLVMMGKPEAIEGMVNSQLTDRDLPLGVDMDENFLVRSYKSNSDTLDETTNWTLFKTWRISEIVFFCDQQWVFLAPVFTKNSHDRFLYIDCPLPFLALPERMQEIRFSHHSKVSRVRIHEAHFETVENEGDNLAVKELHPDSNDEYPPEATTLLKLNRLSNDHLIKCIATYQQGGKHYVVFPWAEKGNLREFWDSESKAMRDIDLVKWVLGQMLGLADALKELHEFTGRENCRHGDLKPENILCFQRAAEAGKGTLVMSDLGSATFHRQDTEKRGTGTGNRGRYGTIRYEPPEVLKKDPRSRRYDVWSMGCIYLEFLIWILYEWNGLEVFYEGLDRYWLEAIASAEVHPRVRIYIEEMQRDPRCELGGALGDLLASIERRLLRVEHGATDDELGSQNTTGGNGDEKDLRADSAELSEILRNIVEKADTTPSYAFDKQCWDRASTNGYGSLERLRFLRDKARRPPILSHHRVVSVVPVEQGDNERPSVLVMPA